MLSVKISLDKQNNLFTEQDKWCGQPPIHSDFVCVAMPLSEEWTRENSSGIVWRLAPHPSFSVDEDVTDSPEMSAFRMSFLAQSFAHRVVCRDQRKRRSCDVVVNTVGFRKCVAESELVEVRIFLFPEKRT